MSNKRFAVVYILVLFSSLILLAILSAGLLGGEWPRRVVVGGSTAGVILLLGLLRLRSATPL